MYNNAKLTYFLLTALSAATLLSACATSVPKAEYNKELPTQYHLDADDKVQVKVDAATGISVTDVEKQQLASMITTKIEERQAKNPANGDVRDCSVVVTITRFDKGNAFARAMVAGDSVRFTWKQAFMYTRSHSTTSSMTSRCQRHLHGVGFTARALRCKTWSPLSPTPFPLR